MQSNPIGYRFRSVTVANFLGEVGRVTITLYSRYHKKFQGFFFGRAGMEGKRNAPSFARLQCPRS